MKKNNYKEGDIIQIISNDTITQGKIVYITDSIIRIDFNKSEGFITNREEAEKRIFPTKIALLLSFLTEEEKIKLKESL